MQAGGSPSLSEGPRRPPLLGETTVARSSRSYRLNNTLNATLDCCRSHDTDAIVIQYMCKEIFARCALLLTEFAVSMLESARK